MKQSAEQQEFRALIVDDDPTGRHMVAFALRQERFVCDTAADGDEALAVLQRGQYDLLVIDLLMPNKHGHALAVDVLGRQSRPKIVVHTSVENPRLTKDLMIRGVDDIVYKPTNYASFAAKAKGMVIRERNLRSIVNVDPPATEKLACSDSTVQQDDEADDRTPVDQLKTNATPSEDVKSPPESQVSRDVANMVHSDSFELEEIADAVERDPAFAAKLLQLANNPLYNPTGKQFTNVLQAVTRIGQKRVGEFALAMSLFAND